jgi:hypothetical protein
VENRNMSLRRRRPAEAADDDGSDGHAQGRRLWSVGSRGTRHVVGLRRRTKAFYPPAVRI